MNFWKTWIKGHRSHDGHLGIQCTKSWAWRTQKQLWQKAAYFRTAPPPTPPAPFHRFPKSNIRRPGGAHVWWTVVQMGSWPHLHSSKGGTNCDYLALKPPPALWPFLNEALSPHISHLGLPTISLKTFIFLFFRDYFPLFYPCYFSEQFFFILCAFLILLL